MPFGFRSARRRLEIESFKSSREDLDAIYFFSPLWRIGVRGAGVTVAVLDSGINTDISSKDFVVYSRDFTEEGNAKDLNDPNDSHGSRIVRCILNIACDVKIANLKVVPYRSHLTRESVCRAIEYCIESFPLYRIINISLNFRSIKNERDKPCRLCQLVDRAVERGIVVVAAASNDSLDILPSNSYTCQSCPARCESSISVTPKHNHNFINYWNNISKWKKILIRLKRFGNVVGYSYTAGYTSGCAALLLSAYPEATPYDIRLAILNGGAKIESALIHLLSDVSYKKAKNYILKTIDFYKKDDFSCYSFNEFVRSLGLVLSFIEYRLLKGFQTERGIDEFIYFQRMIDGKIPSPLEARFKLLTDEVEKQKITPRMLTPEEMLIESSVIKRFSRIEEQLIMREQKIHREPKNIEGWYQKGFLLDQIGRHQDALLAYEEAISIEPTDANSYYFLAKSFYKLGEKEKAIVIAENIAHRWPDNPRVWFGQGVFFFDISYFSKALAFFNKSLSLQPDFKECLQYKETTLRRLADQKAEDSNQNSKIRKG